MKQHMGIFPTDTADIVCFWYINSNMNPVITLLALDKVSISSIQISMLYNFILHIILHYTILYYTTPYFFPRRSLKEIVISKLCCKSTTCKKQSNSRVRQMLTSRNRRINVLLSCTMLDSSDLSITRSTSLE